MKAKNAKRNQTEQNAQEKKIVFVIRNEIRYMKTKRQNDIKNFSLFISFCCCVVVVSFTFTFLFE